MTLLRLIYRNWQLYVNFFQPVRKLLHKTRQDHFVRKHYDVAKTPYQRVLEREDVTEAAKQTLLDCYCSINPVKLKRSVDDRLHQLWRLAR